MSRGMDTDILRRLSNDDPTLSTINLSNRRCGDAAIAMLASAMKNSHCILTDLELSLNGISVMGAQSLAAVIGTSSRSGEYDSLVRIQLNSNEIRDGGACALASALHEMPNLEELHLSENKIGDDGAALLSQKLPLTSIKFLNLYGNLIGLGGSSALGQNLPLLSSLTELNLSGNRIDDHAVGCLVKGIANHPSLKKLCLGFNLIGDVGAEIIANQCLCSNNECLDWLNLHNNPNIGEKGTTSLIQIGLASNYFLREMNIDWVRGTDQSLLDEMNMYLELNRAGRRILREENMGPFAWSCVLGGVATLSSVYYLVRLCPEMCEEGY